MFREFVNSPIEPLSQEYINTFNRIENEPDLSLTCVGIAMLKPRIENYHGMSGCYRSFMYKGDCIQDFKERLNQDDPVFCFYKYTHENTDEDYIKNNLDEFKEKKSISLFVKNNMNYDCAIYYHEEKNAVCICANTIDIRLYHLLLSFISLYYPAIFGKTQMSEDDYNLIKSLVKKDKGDFYVAIKKLLMPYAKDARKMQLSSFLKQMHETKIGSALNDVNNQRRTLVSIEQQYSEAIALLKNLIVIYEGMKATESYDDPEEELVEYLATNENVHNLKFTNNKLCFNVTTILNNYNEQAWETFSNRGHIYDGDYSCHLPAVFNIRDNRKILLDNIFSDNPKLMIKMIGNYMLDMSSCRVMTNDHYDYVSIDSSYASYVPNPHLKLFGCLGGYKDKVMNELKDRNYIGAIELCIASAGSVNLDETTQTFRPFLGWVLSSSEKILVTRDGTEMTPQEALVWLIDKEKENEAN